MAATSTPPFPDATQSSPHQTTRSSFNCLPHALIRACANGDQRAAAHEWARLGLRVLPLWPVNDDGTCACRDPACPPLRRGKHPQTDLVAHGVKDATTDLQLIAEWWFLWEDANVGLVMGAESGVLALDVDPRNGGDDDLVVFERTCPLPPTLTETTGGGQHRLYRVDAGPVPTKKPKRGLEVKGDGSYIATAPSLHGSLRRYRWDDPEQLIAPCPPQLLRLLRAPSAGVGSSEEVVRLLRTPPSATVRAAGAAILRRLRGGERGARAALLAEGVWREYYLSQSEADLALMCFASEYSRDPQVLDAVLRASGLYRPQKWGRRLNYRAPTIQRALELPARPTNGNPVYDVAPRAHKPSRGRGYTVWPQVAQAIVRAVSDTPGEATIGGGFVRLHVTRLAAGLEVDRTTVWRTLDKLLDSGVMETEPVLRTRSRNGKPICHRFVRLSVPEADALSAIPGVAGG